MIIKILDINILKDIPLKYIVQLINLSQIIFLFLIFKFYKNKDGFILPYCNYQYFFNIKIFSKRWSSSPSFKSYF